MPGSTVGEELEVPFTVGAESTPSIVSQTTDLTIRCEVLDGTWETFGVDREVSVLPETLVYSSNDWGFDKASFTLRRLPWASWPDLQPFTPVEIELGGQVVWEGRTNGTPLKAGTDQQINVQCEGWQYSLDDELYQRFYVHSTLTDWKDARNALGATLTTLTAAPTVNAGDGQIVVTWPNAVPTNGRAAVILDLGQGNTAASIVVDWALTVGAANRAWGVGAGATEDAGVGETHTVYNGLPASSGTVLYTFPTPQRYIYIFFDSNSHTPGADETLTITRVLLFSAAAYEASNESVLKATTVAIDALEKGAPGISSDHSQIATAQDEFDFPGLVMAKGQSPREMIESVNALHNWTTKIDRALRLVFAPRPSEATLEFGAWSGEEIEDTSAGEGSEIFNEAIVEGTEANGSALAVPVTSSGSVVSLRGFIRSKAVQVSNVLTQIMGEKLGGVFLEAHERTPFAGAIHATVGSVRNLLSGQPVHPSVLPAYSQELIRISHMIDPNTGGVGRDGLIAAVTYTHATQSAEVSLSNRLDNFDPLLERLAALAGANG